MGWTFFHVEPGAKSIDIMRKQLDDGEYGKVIASAQVRNTLYLAYRQNNGDVYGVVVLTERAKGYHNFGYKVVSEDMGPCDIDCPTLILDMLSEAPNMWAWNWREKCRIRASERAYSGRKEPCVRVWDKIAVQDRLYQKIVATV